MKTRRNIPPGPPSILPDSYPPGPDPSEQSVPEHPTDANRRRPFRRQPDGLLGLPSLQLAITDKTAIHLDCQNGGTGFVCSAIHPIPGRPPGFALFSAPEFLWAGMHFYSVGRSPWRWRIGLDDEPRAPHGRPIFLPQALRMCCLTPQSLKVFRNGRHFGRCLRVPLSPAPQHVGSQFV